MKIQMEMENGKEARFPKFDLMYNKDKTQFCLAIKYLENNQDIIDDIENNLEEADLKGDCFIFETKKVCYIFKFFEKIEIFPKDREYIIFVALLDKNDKIIEQNNHRFKVNENNI